MPKRARGRFPDKRLGEGAITLSGEPVHAFIQRSHATHNRLQRTPMNREAKIQKYKSKLDGAGRTARRALEKVITRLEGKDPRDATRNAERERKAIARQTKLAERAKRKDQHDRVRWHGDQWEPHVRMMRLHPIVDVALADLDHITTPQPGDPASDAHHEPDSAWVQAIVRAQRGQAPATPPICLYRDPDGVLRKADGTHRLIAARHIGLATIRAHVFDSQEQYTATLREACRQLGEEGKL